MTYKVVAVIWNDHMRVSRGELKRTPNMVSTLTFGIIVEKTKQYIIVASDLERYDDRDDSTYMVIYRSNIQAIKEYGEIEIDNLRIAP
jgi:hypothetical protein